MAVEEGGERVKSETGSGNWKLEREGLIWLEGLVWLGGSGWKRKERKIRFYGQFPIFLCLVLKIELTP